MGSLLRMLAERPALVLVLVSLITMWLVLTSVLRPSSSVSLSRVLVTDSAIERLLHLLRVRLLALSLMTHWH